MSRSSHRSLVVALAVLTISVCLPLTAAPSQGGSDEAVKAYREALCKWEAGDQDGAEKGFLAAAQISPNWGAPNARLGVMYQLQGKETEAREQYRLTQVASYGPGYEDGSDGNSSVRCQLVADEAHMIYLVNQARLEDGQPILVPDPVVALVARRHSEEMRDKRYFDHKSPTPGMSNVQDRFRAIFNYRPRLIGENLSRRWGSGYALCPENILEAHHDLMNSPGHRRNILYPTFEWLGMGISVNPNGDFWITEVFVEPGR
ncbi:MAG: CAP domain-containing protein [Armatimonadia bacterium]